ncbi:CsbD family protein [Mycobacterium sp. 852013-50091_SCH5140682]|uniref:CsbD family protein n=1 Tax=Mycobacterium sp. 852013-50091_SCH5140682 TaxID=1834109 RepID=UPI0009EEB4AC|nr:CsbD family protein [Mycobacterium sp. 852013-50091_SCH5140682]
MSGADKARNKWERARGRVKETFGRAVNDSEMEARGRADQRMSHLKDAGEKVKDAFRPRRRRQP